MNDFFELLSILAKMILKVIATILLSVGYIFIMLFLINYVNVPMMYMGIFLGLISIIMILLYILFGFFLALKYGDDVYDKIEGLWW